MQLNWQDNGVKRVVSALVLAPLSAYCVFFGGIFFMALLAVFAVAALWEWWRLVRLFTLPSAKIFTVAVLGFALIMACLLSLWWLRLQERGVFLVVFFLLLIWCTDIGAYVVGRCCKGPKMAPRISPGKTWSGAVGGLLSAILVALLLSEGMYYSDWALLKAALLISISAQIGDLMESQAKRWAGVKDSSQLIPGHGGVLDRVDGILLAAPMYALYHYWEVLP
ncbi:MAG: phosphatidate cytidylyltransferase [Alphaproteobacteria bacterium]